VVVIVVVLGVVVGVVVVVGSKHSSYSGSFGPTSSLQSE